jgi:hypothetical protein
MDDEEEEQKPPLAHWTGIVQPAGLSTKTGKQRFMVTVKLPEKTLKTATSFVSEINDALKLKISKTRGCELAAQFELVDSERTRLQRATSGFFTFKDAQTCLSFLKELGLQTNEISSEFEDFGLKKYDPWYDSISQAWWPWFAAWRNPAPEMPMMKVTNRLDLSEGAKYKEGASGKLGKGDEVDRTDARGDEPENVVKKKSKNKPPKEDDPEEDKPRRKKKRNKSEPREMNDDPPESD